MAHLFQNPGFERSAYDKAAREILNLAAGAAARRAISQWPGYEPTPLRSLDTLACRLGLGAILYKDESARFGLGSFKALGGAYAVEKLLRCELGGDGGTSLSTTELFTDDNRGRAAAITVCCATDGNHGRSVAWGAQTFGCRAVIFLHEGVSPAREAAIAAYGAAIVRTAGNYDDSVRAASEMAASMGWHVISDTSYPGYTDVPRDVMQGYSVLLAECDQQLVDGQAFTHAFVQGGVGGLAASVCAHLWERFDVNRPTFVVVEPEAADCLYRSAMAGKPVAVHGSLDTVMAMLACGEVSLLAWSILAPGANAFMTIEDKRAVETMRLLAKEFSIVAGESGGAGLAGLIAAAEDFEMRHKLGLDAKSSVLVIGTEGDTDPALFTRIVGRSAADVRAGREVAA